ncbi:lipase family protein [Williamsia sp.]|uniref:lipase family protein n=1 Tax=Williamsia sp. TaxID=1872085 RepID=UPI0039C98EE1
MRLSRWISTVAIVGLVQVAGATALAQAEPDTFGGFYTPPTDVSADAGTVLKTQSMPLYASIPGLNGSWPGEGQRVMYTSALQDGTPTAVTGSLVEPGVPWTGGGPRPTIVIGPGTVGQGDQCAPSRNFPTALRVTNDPLSASINYEVISADRWLAEGARVFMTDYVGLGTPGLHTYVNRAEEAHAMLDGARAALALGDDPDAPIAFWGYSQGGGAAAAAAELQPTYAPELNVKGTFAGAPPADLLDVLPAIDNNLIAGAIGYALNGFVERNPVLAQVVDMKFTDAGKAVLKQISTECIGDSILSHPFLSTASMTKDGRSMLDNVRDTPAALAVIEDQQIGKLKPTSPVLVTNNVADDVIPYAQARRMAQSWCDQGATVEFRSNTIPPILSGTAVNHALPLITDGMLPGGGVDYLLDRFAGKPLAGCQFN